MRLNQEWLIGDEVWRSKTVKQCNTPGNDGECDPSTLVMQIKRNKDKQLMRDTLIHELLHAIEYSYEIEIGEKMILILERPLRKFIEDNF